MKILFDSTIFWQQKFGGISNYWMELMKRFSFSKNEMSILTFDEKYYKNEFPLRLQNYTFVKDRKVNPKYLRFFSAPKLKEKDDVVFHSTYLRISKQKNIKTVITLHDFTHQKYMNFWHKTINSYMKRKAIRQADGIICISNNTLKDLKEFYPDLGKKKVTVIYNGANFDIFREMNVTKLPEEFSYLNGKKYLLFVGGRAGYKNFDFALRLLDCTKDYVLCVVGGGDLPSAIKAKYQGRIIQYANVSDESLCLLYNKAFLFIYPSLYEGFGIPIAEAMNCGCPVMAFDNSSIPEVMNGAGILLENNDLDAALLALSRLEGNDYRSQIIKAQYEACRKFSWDRTYEDVLRFYESLYTR